MKSYYEAVELNWIDEDDGADKYCMLNISIDFFAEVRESSICAGEPETYDVSYFHEGDEPPESLINEYIQNAINNMN